MTFQQFLDQVKNRGNSLTGVNDANNPLTLSNSKLDAPDHPQGLWGNLMKIAQMRGDTASATRAKYLQDEERTNKQMELQDKLNSSGMDSKYKQALMDKMGYDQKQEDTKANWDNTEKMLSLDSKSAGTPQQTGKMITAPMDQQPVGEAPYMRSPITPEVQNQNPVRTLPNGMTQQMPTIGQQADLAAKTKDEEARNAAKYKVDNIPDGGTGVVGGGLLPPGTVIDGKPKEPKNPGMRDRISDGHAYANGQLLPKGTTYREYFNEADPATVTHTVIIGDKSMDDRNSPGSALRDAMQAEMKRTGDAADAAYSNVTGMRGDMGEARKQVGEIYKKSTDAERRLATMENAAKAYNGPDIQKSGAADLILLSNHIAMTFGDVSGARTGQQLIEAHEKARDLPDSLMVMLKGVTGGQQLSPNQRQDFITAARERVSEFKDQLQKAEKIWQYHVPADRENHQDPSVVKVQPTPKSNLELFDKIPLANGTFGYRRKP